MSATRGSTGLVADTISFSSVDGPGNRFVVFLQGCNFDCVACHNPQTIPGHGHVDGHRPRHVTVDELLDDVRRAEPFLSGITISGGEATQQSSFVQAIFEAMRADTQLARLTRFVDSNGACSVEVWDRLAPVMDGAMIDLKCLDDSIHRRMTGSSNSEVLASIEHVSELGALFEVRLLLIAGVNDDPALLERTARWLAAVDPSMRVKIIGFRPHGARPHDPPLVAPSTGDLARVADLFAGAAPFDVCVV